MWRPQCISMLEFRQWLLESSSCVGIPSSLNQRIVHSFLIAIVFTSVQWNECPIWRIEHNEVKNKRRPSDCNCAHSFDICHRSGVAAIFCRCLMNYCSITSLFTLIWQSYSNRSVRYVINDWELCSPHHFKQEHPSIWLERESATNGSCPICLTYRKITR